uniref:DUF4283 domain-containing protein n=1 Tax=Quercus lobata TaxID=97700 RepID=A0A7N2L820_QUELO
MEVSDLVARTKDISCQDTRLELPPRQTLTKNTSLIFLAKLLTTKPSNLNIVKQITFKAWKPSFPLDVKLLSKDVLMFTFQHERTKENLLKIGSKIGEVAKVDFIGDNEGPWLRAENEDSPQGLEPRHKAACASSQQHHTQSAAPPGDPTASDTTHMPTHKHDTWTEFTSPVHGAGHSTTMTVKQCRDEPTTNSTATIG